MYSRAGLEEEPPFPRVSQASCLAIQQIGHLLLCAGDLALVQHAKTVSLGLSVCSALGYSVVFGEAGDLALRIYMSILVVFWVQYQDDASSFPFLWSSSMDFRYFR